MRRLHHDRTTRVLVYGHPYDKKFQNIKSAIKSSLQGAHMGWDPLVDTRLKVEEAVAYIREHEDLEIVYISDTTSLSRLQLGGDARLIAKALSEHPHKPWAAFSTNLNYLKGAFDAAGIPVRQCMLDQTIYERWYSQTPNEDAA